MKESELTQNQIEYLERYEPINESFLMVDTIEHNLELAEDREDIEGVLSDIAYYESDLIPKLNNWIDKIENIKYNAKHFDFTNQQELDRQEFYNDHIHGCY